MVGVATIWPEPKKSPGALRPPRTAAVAALTEPPIAVDSLVTAHAMFKPASTRKEYLWLRNQNVVGVLHAHSIPAN